MKKIIFLATLLLSSAVYAGSNSNPGLYYGQVPTAAQWNSYFSTKLDYLPGTNNSVPYWDAGGNLLAAPISGDCTSTANVFTCTAIHSPTVSGNLTFTSSGARILGDLTNATVANRLAVKTSTTNGNTYFGILPDGTATQSYFSAHNSADPTNSAVARLKIDSTAAYVESGINGTGTYLPLQWWTGGAQHAALDTSGNYSVTGLFTQGDPTAPAGIAQLGGMFSTNTAIGAGLIVRKSTTGANPADLYLIRSRGTNASPTALVSGDSVGRVLNLGFDGSSYLSIAQILSVVDSTVSTGIIPTRTVFYTANSAGTLTEALRIDSAQNVLVTGPGGLGYGTGSGGTVTQTTSKNTAVTLNKLSGQITMNNSALAAGATATFTVNNSFSVGTDNIIPTFAGGGIISNYNIWAQSGATGSFSINVKNISAGSLSDALVINFVIIKTATN